MRLSVTLAVWMILTRVILPPVKVANDGNHIAFVGNNHPLILVTDNPMDMTDKVLQLLTQGPLTKDDFCLQLGRSWDDIREAVGLTRVRMWVALGEVNQENFTNRSYVLTDMGKKEIDRRIKEAAKRNVVSSKSPDRFRMNLQAKG